MIVAVEMIYVNERHWRNVIVASRARRTGTRAWVPVGHSGQFFFLPDFLLT